MISKHTAQYIPSTQVVYYGADVRDRCFLVPSKGDSQYAFITFEGWGPERKPVMVWRGELFVDPGDDYEACGDCGYDHAYEQDAARREHALLDRLDLQRENEGARQ